MSQLCALKILFVILLLLNYTRCASVNSNLQFSETFKSPKYVYCENCYSCFCAGEQFLRHARSFHADEYDSQFLTSYKLYFPVVEIDMSSSDYEICQICGFAILHSDLERHVDSFHVASARSARIFQSSKLSDVPGENKRHQLSPASVLCDNEYIKRFGDRVPNFDEYCSNIRLLYEALDGQASGSDRSKE